MLALVLSILAFFVALLACVRAFSFHYQESRELAQMRMRIEAAQQLLKQRGDLANEIAHEIKNPLTAILCSAETLDMLIGNTLQEDHRKSLRYIKEYGDNLLRLVSDFLDLSRSESGHIQARPEAVSIVPCIESVIGLLKANALKKNISVHVFAPDPSLDALVDPRHFKQIIFNLLHNALKFTPENGEVHVAVEREFPNPYLTVVVGDTGPGIPAHELPNLFQLYCRSDSNKREGGVGVGLGLALTKALSELNGGTVSCESCVGVGTAFTVTLPFLTQPDETAPPPSRSGSYVRRNDGTVASHDQGQPLSGQSFLVVDQDDGTRDAIAKLINAWGGLVDSVAQAADAVKALENRTYDAVMIDDTLKGIDSLELIKKIREEARLKETTIIIAASSPASAELIEGTGVGTCVSKPLNGKRLLKSLVNSGKYQTTH